MTTMRIPVAAAVALLSVATLAPAPASAACFEFVGCTNDHVMPYSALRQLSCGALWTVRNTIFYENGYCFQTDRGRAVFDNTGCSYYNSGQVPMSRIERTNVDRVRQVERQKGCR